MKVEKLALARTYRPAVRSAKVGRYGSRSRPAGAVRLPSALRSLRGSMIATHLFRCAAIHAL
jgi:hypothetical protein